MQFSLLPGHSPLKTVGFSAFVALMLGVVSHASAQASYSTNFDNFDNNTSVSGQDNWDTNDANQPDEISINGYSTSPTDQNALLGGALIFAGSPPSQNTVNLFHPFTPDPTVHTIGFNTDFAITTSTAAAPNNDTFGFTFRNGNTNLFSVDFVPNATSNATLDSIEYSVNNANFVSTMQGFPMNQRAHLSIFVNELTNNMTFTVSTDNTSLTRTVSLGAVDPTTVDNFAVTYIESVPAAPGSNAVVFDNISAVPEPKTYAMLALGAMGLGLRFWRRTRA